MFKTLTQGKHTILSHPDYFNEVDLNWFDADYWQQQNKIVVLKKAAPQPGFLNTIV
tara:strand:- start:1023 stop:1190 length:168 start_codon:yes stop_codon:yes gene_type:complete